MTTTISPGQVWILAGCNDPTESTNARLVMTVTTEEIRGLTIPYASAFASEPYHFVQQYERTPYEVGIEDNKNGRPMVCGYNLSAPNDPRLVYYQRVANNDVAQALRCGLAGVMRQYGSWMRPMMPLTTNLAPGETVILEMPKPLVKDPANKLGALVRAMKQMGIVSESDEPPPPQYKVTNLKVTMNGQEVTSFFGPDTIRTFFSNVCTEAVKAMVPEDSYQGRACPGCGSWRGAFTMTKVVDALRVHGASCEPLRRHLDDESMTIEEARRVAFAFGVLSWSSDSVADLVGRIRGAATASETWKTSNEAVKQEALSIKSADIKVIVDGQELQPGDGIPVTINCSPWDHHDPDRVFKTFKTSLAGFVRMAQSAGPTFEETSKKPSPFWAIDPVGDADVVMPATSACGSKVEVPPGGSIPFGEASGMLDEELCLGGCGKVSRAPSGRWVCSEACRKASNVLARAEQRAAAGSPLRRWLRAERAHAFPDEASAGALLTWLREVIANGGLLPNGDSKARWADPWQQRRRRGEPMRRPMISSPALRPVSGAAARRPCPTCGKLTVAGAECQAHADVRALLDENDLVGRST